MGNLATALKYLRDNRVKKGDSAESAARSDRMNAIADAILAIARGDHMRRGPGIRMRTSEGMVIIASDADEGGGGGTVDLPFAMTIVNQEGETDQYAVQIIDGKVNNEWPDVGTTAMGATGGPGYGTLNIANIENSNIFIRVMFKASTNHVERLDIYERPNETYPQNKITAGEPVAGACDAIDSPDTAPPAGYGSIHILLGFTYVKPPVAPATEGSPTAFNLVLGNINFELIAGAFDGQPAVIPMHVYSGWTKYPVPDSP